MSGIADRLRRTLGSGPLRVRAFALLAVGQFTSSIGDMFYAIALPWLILSNDGGAVELGVVVGCYGAARAVGIPVGGMLSDRYSPRRIMMVTDATRLVLTGALGALAVTGQTPLALLAPVAFLHGLCGGAFLPASRSIMPSLLPEAELTAGNSLYTAISQTGSLIGPAVGGIVVAAAGSGPALLVDAATFAVSAVTLLAIRPAPHAEMGATAEPGDDSGRAGPSFATVLRHGKLLHALCCSSARRTRQGASTSCP